MEPIQLRFTLMQDDYRRAISAYNWKLPRTRITMGALVVGVVLVACGAVGSLMRSGWMPYPTMWLELGAIAFGLVFGVFRVFLVPMLIARRFSKDVLRQSVFNYEITPDYFLARSLHSESRVTWDFFDAVTETKEFYLLTQKLNKGQFTFIPKSAFRSIEQEADFQHIVEAHLGAIKK